MKKLDLYGYSETDDKQLLKLREVTICADSKQVRAISEFFVRCANEMDANPEWGHQHFGGGGEASDIIVCSYRLTRALGD